MIYVKNNTNQQRIFIPKNEFTFNQDVALQGKDYTITENGEYPIEPDSGYVGISGGTITVEVAASTAETYQEGYEAGEAAQKAKLTSVTLTGNTTVMREDGYSAVTVDVSTAETYQDGYEDGYASGETEGYNEGYSSGQTAGYEVGVIAGKEAQKSLMTITAFTGNGVYARENGWNSVAVSVPTAGTLSSQTFTINGEYVPEHFDGWSAITIAVPTSAGTNIPFTGSSVQIYAAQAVGMYNFQKTANDNIQRLIINFPTTGTTIITAYYEPSTDKDVKLYYSGSRINSITIDDGVPMAATSTTYMTEGGHKVEYDMEYNDAGISFEGCPDLIEVDFGNSYCSTIGGYWFNGSSVELIKMPRCETIDSGAFLGAYNIDSFPQQEFPLLKTIYVSAFEESSISYIDAPIEEIYTRAFSACTSLEYISLYYCRLIAANSFSHCNSLTEISLPAASACTIMHEAFSECTGLTTINCGSVNVENVSIDYRAFDGCHALSDIQVTAFVDPPTIMDSNQGTWIETNNPFYNIPASGTVTLRSDITQNYIDAWTTWAATYLPGWTVQLAS